MCKIIVNYDYPELVVDDLITPDIVIEYALWYHAQPPQSGFKCRVSTPEFIEVIHDAMSRNRDMLYQIAEIVANAKNMNENKEIITKYNGGKYKRLLTYILAGPMGIKITYTFETIQHEDHDYVLYYFEADPQEDPIWVHKKDYAKYVRNREWSPRGYWSEKNIPRKVIYRSIVNGIKIQPNDDRKHTKPQKRMEIKHSGLSTYDYDLAHKFRDWVVNYISLI